MGRKSNYRASYKREAVAKAEASGIAEDLDIHLMPLYPPTDTIGTEAYRRGCRDG
jgi:hypothetical protein